MALIARHLIVITPPGEMPHPGIAEVLLAEPIHPKGKLTGIEKFQTIDAAIAAIQELFNIDIEYLDQGFYKIEGCRPDPLGLMTQFQILDEADEADGEESPGSFATDDCFEGLDKA